MGCDLDCGNNVPCVRGCNLYTHVHTLWTSLSLTTFLSLGLTRQCRSCAGGYYWLMTAVDQSVPLQRPPSVLSRTAHYSACVPASQMATVPHTVKCVCVSMCQCVCVCVWAVVCERACVSSVGAFCDTLHWYKSNVPTARGFRGSLGNFGDMHYSDHVTMGCTCLSKSLKLCNFWLLFENFEIETSTFERGSTVHLEEHLSLIALSTWHSGTHHHTHTPTWEVTPVHTHTPT